MVGLVSLYAGVVTVAYIVRHNNSSDAGVEALMAVGFFVVTGPVAVFCWVKLLDIGSNWWNVAILWLVIGGLLWFGWQMRHQESQAIAILKFLKWWRPLSSDHKTVESIEGSLSGNWNWQRGDPPDVTEEPQEDIDERMREPYVRRLTWLVPYLTVSGLSPLVAIVIVIYRIAQSTA